MDGNTALYRSALRHGGVHGAIGNWRVVLALFKCKNESARDPTSYLENGEGRAKIQNHLQLQQAFPGQASSSKLKLHLDSIKVRRHGRRECMGGRPAASHLAPEHLTAPPCAVSTLWLCGN